MNLQELTKSFEKLKSLLEVGRERVDIWVKNNDKDTFNAWSIQLLSLIGLIRLLAWEKLDGIYHLMDSLLKSLCEGKEWE